jgi:hypothetical protein
VLNHHFTSTVSSVKNGSLQLSNWNAVALKIDLKHINIFKIIQFGVPNQALVDPETAPS